MKNVTISMDDDVASWVRIEAAKEGKSVSRYLGDLLRDKRNAKRLTQLEVLDAILSGPAWDLSDENGQLPSREELYDERFAQLLRRHERPDLPEGQSGDGKA